PLDPGDLPVRPGAIGIWSCSSVGGLTNGSSRKNKRPRKGDRTERTGPRPAAQARTTKTGAAKDHHFFHGGERSDRRNNRCVRRRRTCIPDRKPDYQRQGGYDRHWRCHCSGRRNYSRCVPRLVFRQVNEKTESPAALRHSNRSQTITSTAPPPRAGLVIVVESSRRARGTIDRRRGPPMAPMPIAVLPSSLIAAAESAMTRVAISPSKRLEPSDLSVACSRYYSAWHNCGSAASPRGSAPCRSRLRFSSPPYP